jgi:NTP pyrophosphatase (non-canonical NTP hydrolase)
MVLDAEQVDMWDYWDEAQPTPEPDTTTTMDKVREFAKTTGQEPSVTRSAKLIEEEYAEWHEEIEIGYAKWFKDFTEFGVPVKELKELADLVYVIYGYANVRHWDLEEAIKRVHENNLGRCIQPDGSIKRREDGKILKNPDYPSVVLDDLV